MSASSSAAQPPTPEPTPGSGAPPGSGGQRPTTRPTTRPTNGEQYVLTAGPARAVVCEVGAVLREFTVDGVPYVETYDADVLPPKGCGAILVPWPNRVRRGRWSYDGLEQQLAVSEPARGNALHGLARHLSWHPDSPVADPAGAGAAITLRATVNAQPGWPVPLSVAVTYALDAEGLRVTHAVRNLGAAPIPFGVGAHPYPRAGAAETDECTLRLAADSVLPLHTESLTPSEAPRPVEGETDFRAGRPLRGVTLDTPFGGCVPAQGDTLIRHTLTGPGGGVEVWAEPEFGWVQAFTPTDFPGRGRAVAIEPMTCPPDALNSGVDLCVVDPGETWSASWGLRPLPAG